MAAGATHTIDRVGIFSPKPTEVDTLGPGEIGFINSGIKVYLIVRWVTRLLKKRIQQWRHYPDLNHLNQLFCGMFQLTLMIMNICETVWLSLL